MLQRGLLTEDLFYRFDPATNAYVRCTVPEWQNEMIQEGHYTDDIFVRTLAELLQRQIILYPVIPDPDREGDRITISPSQETIHEPFHIYNDAKIDAFCRGCGKTRKFTGKVPGTLALCRGHIFFIRN